MNHPKYLVLILAITLLYSCNNTPTPPQSQPVTPKLSATYHSFDDIAHIFEYENDTTYVINFWATWCSPCVAELPYFEKINQAYQQEKIKVILVSLDSKKHIESKLKPFIQKEKLSSEVLVLTDINYNAWIDKVSPDWDGAIPATYIYNREEYEFIGGEFSNYEELHSIIKPYLKS